jgi:hypothetical protein
MTDKPPFIVFGLTNGLQLTHRKRKQTNTKECKSILFNQHCFNSRAYQRHLIVTTDHLLFEHCIQTGLVFFTATYY